jgi:hypothetical protein
MAEIHGSSLKVTINAVDITSYLMDETKFKVTREKHDNTRFGDTGTKHTVSPVKTDEPFTIGGRFSTESHAVINPLVNGGSALSLLIQPGGTTSGMPKKTGTCSVTDYEWDSPKDKPSTWTALVTPQGDLVDGTNA